MIIYISGKITGCDDYKERFAVAETYLRGQGHKTINPARIDLGKDATWQQYMKFDLYLLGLCDAIYMLDNWIESRGARIEWMFAKTKGLKIVEEKLKAGGENDDLISRSKLIMRLSDYALQESPNDNESTGEQRISKMIYDAIQNCISCVEEQPTAYSVDKVVEDVRCRCYEMGLDESQTEIVVSEIVKQGGVADDLCGKR